MMLDHLAAEEVQHLVDQIDEQKAYAEHDDAGLKLETIMVDLK